MIIAAMRDAQRLPLFRLLERRDPTERKHGGAATSRAAHELLRPHKRRIYLEILRLYRQAGAQGLTAKEVAARLGRPLHAVSGRITELRSWMFIYRLEARREASAVLVHRRCSAAAFL